MEAATALAAFFFVLETGGWQYGDPSAMDAALYRITTTACLSAIVVMLVVSLFLCRSERVRSVGAGRPGGLIWAGPAVEIALILFIDYTPSRNGLFGTAPLPVTASLSMMPFAIGMALLEGVRTVMLANAQ